MMKIIINLKVYRDIKVIENYMMHSDLLTMRERSREREEVIQKKKMRYISVKQVQNISEIILNWCFKPTPRVYKFY